MTSASANGDCNGCIVRLGGAEKLLKEAIMFTLKKSEFLAATHPRATSVQSVGKTLLSLSGINEKIFKKFSQDLVKLLSKSFQSISKCRSNSKRGRLWTTFHKLSIKELPCLWSNLLVTLQIGCKEPLFYQTVNNLKSS